MGLHLAAERVQLRPAIAQTLLGQVAVIGEAVEAVGPGQVDAGMDQLPQDVLQLSGVFQHRLLLGVIGGLAARPVPAGQSGPQLSAAEQLPMDRIFGGGRQLLIQGRQLGDAGLQVPAPGVNLVVQGQQAAQLGAEGLVQSCGIGTFGNGGGQGLAVQAALQPGQGILQLRLVKFVGDVVEGPDEGHRLAQGHLLLQGVPLPDHVQQVLRAGGLPGPAGQGVIPGLEGLHIGTVIGNIGKFPILVHSVTPLDR